MDLNIIIKKMSEITLKYLTELVMLQARDKGFGTKPDEINLPEKMALIHTEIAEAFEAYRKDNMDGKDGFAEELGDTVMRILHLAGIYGIDLEAEMIKKLRKNLDRKWDWSKLRETHT